MGSNQWQARALVAVLTTPRGPDGRRRLLDDRHLVWSAGNLAPYPYLRTVVMAGWQCWLLLVAPGEG